MTRARRTVAILCGGRGTRLQGHAESLPKPLVEIGGRPILWHVMQIYLAQGFRRFLLLTGYRGEQIARFVAASSWPEEAEIRCLETGI
ncbi:MAG: NTP transferase domain-containing protein, partial [Solirubrobacterales bacterium]|nr:NTP transferase domain-containing protein [Solirubrobacterales bacterium]